MMDLGWIWTDNLLPLLLELAQLTGYRFDDSDWIAVEHGVRETDSETGPCSSTHWAASGSRWLWSPARMKWCR